MDLQMTVSPIINFGALTINLASEPWLTQGLRCLIAGSSGSGKSHTMNIWAEELNGLGVPFLVIDPDEEYAGLAALPGVVVVGDGGGIRLDSKGSWRKEAVKLLGDGTGVILNLADLSIDEQRAEYVAVTELLFNRQRGQKRAGQELDVVFILLEEAHLFAPAKNATRARDAIDTTYQVARRGRKFGLNLVASTQRPRDLCTDVRSQFNTRFIGRLDEDIDHRAVTTYLPPHIRHGALLKLQTGEFYFTIRGSFEKIKIRPRKTKDMGSTPVIKYRQHSLFEVSSD